VLRSLAIGRIAPEVRASRVNGIFLGVTALVVFGAAVAGTIGGSLLRSSHTGYTQVEYNSTEPFGTAPGARLFYFPESHEVVMRGWLLGPLTDGSTYQLWAERDGDFLRVGQGSASDIIGFTFLGRAPLRGVDRIFLTIEPRGADLRRPSVEPVVTLERILQ
jgi:hypothetical protein